MKICTKCKIEKSISEFQKQQCKKDGLRYHCKVCRATKRLKEYPEKREHILKTNYAYSKARKEVDISFKIAGNLRIRLNKAIQNKQKTGSAIKDLGCSVDELIVYLESKFKEGMNWENHAYKGWHIDHIVPLCSFDLEDSEQLKKACHYTNLQPLWYNENMKKGGKHE